MVAVLSKQRQPRNGAIQNMIDQPAGADPVTSWHDESSSCPTAPKVERNELRPHFAPTFQEALSSRDATSLTVPRPGRYSELRSAAHGPSGIWRVRTAVCAMQRDCRKTWFCILPGTAS